MAMLTRLLAALLLVVVTPCWYGTKAAAAPANCSLVLTGYGTGSVGVKQAVLACSGGDSPVTVAVNRTYIGKGHVSRFSGVQLTADLECMRYVHRLEQPFGCIFYLCGKYDLVVTGAVVEDVNACASQNATATSPSLLCVGDGAKVTFLQGRFGRNCGRHVISVLDIGEVTIKQSAVSWNRVQTGLYARDSSGLHVVSSNLTNNAAASLGGGVYARDNTVITVDNCKLANNSAVIGGGVCAVANATVAVSFSSFANNTAGALGGGIFARNNATVAVSFSVFGWNKALAGGGVLAAGFAAVAVDSCSFANNSAAVHGGGVYAADNETIITISSSSFANNSAGGWGGGVCAHSNATVTVSSTSFGRNTAARGGGTAAGNFAALAVDNCIFANNSAGGVVNASGGGVYASDNATVTVILSSFERNNAPYGGGVLADGLAALAVDNCSFSNNSAVNSGGGVYASDNATVTVILSSFERNNASYGGGVLANGLAALAVDNCSFSNNSAVNSGGGVYAGGNANVSVSSSSFDMNNANYGGAMFAVYKSAVDNCSFANNRAAHDGGGICAHGTANMSISLSSFDMNNAAHGGGVYAGQNAYVAVSWSSFVNNTAANNGGGINTFDNATITLGSSSFASNNGDFGGAFMANGGFAAMDNCSFVNNTAQTFGGGVYAGNNASVTVSSSSFANNHAGNAGGVAALDFAAMTIHNTTFARNNALYGGGVRAGGSSATTLHNCTFTNHTSQTGAVVYADDHANVSVSWSSFARNTARYGGGLYAGDSAVMTIGNCSVASNNATMSGGGIHAEGNAMVAIHASTMVRNSALLGGGVFVSGSGNLSVCTASNISSNIAWSRGGGLDVQGSVSFVLDDTCSVQDNSAGDGGGLYIARSAAASTANFVSVIQNNSATFNPDIAAEPVQIHINGSTTIPQFVSRYARDQGLLPFVVNVSGIGGIGYEGLLLQATSNGRDLSGGILRTNRAGIGNFSDLKIRGTPGDYLVRFQVTDTSQSVVGHLNFTVGVHIRECVAGEVVMAGDTCEPCTLGYYSFNPGNITCDTCVPHATCLGGSTLIPDPGYWHSAATSPQVHRCPNPAACEGNRAHVSADVSEVERQCTQGYRGHLCGSCVAGYGISRQLTCEPCLRDTARVVAAYAAACLAMLALLVYIVHTTVKDNEGAAATGATVDASDLLKVLILYMQYMVVVAGMRIDWPITLTYPFKALTWLWASSTFQTISLDCQLGNAGLPLAVKRVLVAGLTPWAMLASLLIVEVLLCLLIHRKSFSFLTRVKVHAVVAVLVAVFTFFPGLVRTALSMFACVTIDAPEYFPYGSNAVAIGSFWASDLEQACWQGYHKPWALVVGVGGVLVLCVAVPAAVALVLWCNRHQLSSPSFRSHFGFLCHNYRPSCYLWEVVVTMQTVALMAISVFGYVVGIYYQLILLGAILALAIFLVVVFKPYSSVHLHRYQVGSFGCLFVTAYISLSFLPAFDGRASDDTYKNIMGIMVLLLNVFFMSVTIYNIITSVPWQRLTSCVIRALSLNNMRGCLGGIKIPGEVKPGGEGNVKYRGFSVQIQV
eukprot:jgi/Chrzof1/12423/Cz06g34050.t1